MLVKCRHCGIKIEKNDAFKAVVRGKNLYYCNEAEYKEIIAKREAKDKTYLCIYDIFQYKVTNTILFKEVGALGQIYTFSKMFSYIQQNKEYLIEVMSKDFVSEYAKIRYFAAILKNNLKDYKAPYPEILRSADTDMPTNKYKRKKKRRSLSEIEMEVGEEISENL